MTIQYYRLDVDDIDDLPDEVKEMITEGDRIRRRQAVLKAVGIILAFALGVAVGFRLGVA